MDRAQRILVDRRCSHIAARQYGIITRRQLLEAGLTVRQAERMVTGSRWRVILPGTYAQASVLTSLQQRAMAAVQWAGPSAAASFETACALRRFADSVSEPVEVSSRRKLRSEQVVVHHVQPWAPAEIELADGIPVTSMERTLVDMASRELAPRLQELVDEALRRSLTTVDRLDSYARTASGSGRRGPPALRLLLPRYTIWGGFSESILETRCGDYWTIHPCRSPSPSTWSTTAPSSSPASTSHGRT
jgi:predicted transcriptional regulator of viral defense system